MHIDTYKVKYDFELFDKVFMKEDILYITASFYVMNGKFDYARKVFDKDRRCLGTVRSSYFNETIEHYLIKL